MTGLTFLGTGNYKETTYQWQTQRCTTALFPEAFVTFFPPDGLNVVLTTEAQDKHFVSLAGKVGSKTDIQEVRIPNGQNETELWEMFDLIVDSIPAGETICIDVTHGFRSQPILVLAICLYLRTAKNVTIERIVYGAWEARDVQTNISPVFDLTPFLRLIDWTVAVDKFVQSGNAREVAHLLRSAHREPYLTGQAAGLPQHLSVLARRLDELSLSLRAIRPKETLNKASETVALLDKVEQEAANWAKPFAVLLEQVKKEYMAMAVDETDLFEERGLKAQVEMMKWYIEKGQHAQAITLARELIVTLGCKRLGADALDDREDVTRQLGEWADALRKHHFFPESGSEINKRAFAELWTTLAQLRNDVDHAGMRNNPSPASGLVKNIERACAMVEKEFEKWFAGEE